MTAASSTENSSSVAEDRYESKINKAFAIMVAEVNLEDLAKKDYSAGYKRETEVLTHQEQQKTIAALARYLQNAHPGFTNADAPNIAFSEDVKFKIKEQLVKLYLTPKERTVNDLTKELFKFGVKYVPDNHFNIFTVTGKHASTLFSNEESKQFLTELQEFIKDDTLDISQKGKIEAGITPRKQVGENLFNDTTIDLLKSNNVEILNDKKGKNWRITKIKQNGKELTLLGLTKFHAADSNGFSLETINDFCDFAKEFSKQEYKKSDGVIVDLRGNHGGWPYLGDYMARSFYGNEVSASPLTSVKIESYEANLSRLYMAKAPLEDRLKAPKISKQDSVAQKELWSDKLPFNPQLGYCNPVIVLTDRSTSSNAEATCMRMKANPYVRFAGENTSGCIQYTPAATGTTAIPLPGGIRVAIPVDGASSAFGERVEGIGYKPDYPTERGKNALFETLNNFETIRQDIIEHLPEERKGSYSFGRDPYIDELTKRNLEVVRDNPELQNAVQRLSNLTKHIPQQSLSNNLSKGNSL